MKCSLRCRGKTALGVLTLALLGYLLISPGIALADEITLTSSIEVKDMASCGKVGGSWENTDCLLSGNDRLTVTLGVTLSVASSVMLRNESGTVHNDGVIQNNGVFDNSQEKTSILLGVINNHGILVNHGTFFNRSSPVFGTAEVNNFGPGRRGVKSNSLGPGTIYNDGILNNLGLIAGDYHWDGDIINSGAISNGGTISVGYIHNTGTLSNDETGEVSMFGTALGGGWMLNDGGIVNAGIFEFSGSTCCPATLENRGSFTNYGRFFSDGSVYNQGTFLNGCLATAKISSVIGAAIRQLPCPGQLYVPLVLRSTSSP